MIGMEILQPVAVLAGWTMLVWLWMYATRIPAMGKAGIDSKSLVGGTGKNLDGVLPDNVQWIAHNYNHLHEAPTVFYAVALASAIVGGDIGGGLNALFHSVTGLLQSRPARHGIIEKLRPARH